MSFIDQYGWLIIFAIIILFTVLTMVYYSKKDIYDPEPPGRLFLGFILGVISVIPAVILSLIGSLFVGGNPVLLGILVAPVMEEIAKLWFVIYLARSDNFDGPLDGLIYGAMVGCGFAAAENLLYGWAAVTTGGFISGVTLTTFRSLTQIIGHPLYTGLAGVGVGEWKVGLESGKYSKIYRSMLFHGLWNLSASLSPLSLSVIGLIGVVIGNIYILRKELKRTLELDRDAYERGYYDQKQKMMELKKQGINPDTPWKQQSARATGRWPPGQPTSPKPQIGTPPESLSHPINFNTFPISESHQEDPAKSIDKPKIPNFCKICGTKRLEGDRFCRNCGNQLVK